VISGRPGLWQHHRYIKKALLALIAGFLTVGFPVAIGLFEEHQHPSDWASDDWAAVYISIYLGFLFFFLAIWVDRDAERRARAVANAELITSMGGLAMSSARVVAGADYQALRIPADAHAALQHYPHASPEEQQGLLSSIVEAFINLVFTTFCRADALPRSEWLQLCRGADAVVSQSMKLSKGLGRRQDYPLEGLAAMGDHVRFAQSIGTQMRSFGASKPHRSVELARAWSADDVPSDSSPRPFSQPSPTVQPEVTNKSSEGRKRITRLKTLYRHELTVLHDWEVLMRNAHKRTFAGCSRPISP
jgi:hypothetical protein